MADPLIGKVLAEKYEILERIGEGGMGVVYLARQRSNRRRVAVKVLGAHVAEDGTWVERFRNEARALSKLSSPHTVRVYESGETADGIFYIAMELLEGGRTLREEIDRAGRLPAARALAILEQACRSLAEAHARGILHRDLKPDNLYVNQAPGTLHVRVLDFSVAKLEGTALTNANMALGTPAYMSPEHVRGGQGPHSDVYALGVLLHEMLAGRPPFEARLPVEVLMAHLRQEPPSLVALGVPAQAAAVAERALAKNPAQRHAGCDEMAAACAAAITALEPRPATATATTTTTTTSDPMARTLIASAPTLRATLIAPVEERTLVLPSSSGIAAFAQREAAVARALALATASSPPRRARPAGPLFWSAWVLLGVGVGLATWLVQATRMLAS